VKLTVGALSRKTMMRHVARRPQFTLKALSDRVFKLGYFRFGSLCKALHSGHYAQLRTMRS
jgi:hypothetical protein